MELTWLGTAGFIIKSNGVQIAFDPFLSRGEGVPSPFSAKSFENVDALFVGHGHFDHAYDIPEIAKCSDLKVYAPGLTGQVLKLRGVRQDQLLHSHNKECLYKPLKVQAFKSSHMKFDLPLVFSTIKRCGIKGCLHTLGLGISYPKGMVQTYLFEDNGRKCLFISSAGCTLDELKNYRNLEIDFLLIPLQGHSHIQDIAAEMTTYISPKVVIPHHYDDFFPPLSQSISVELFKESLKSRSFKGEVIEVPLFKTVHL